jgi:hypothetical protein
MNAQRANEIQALLEGIPLPATRSMLAQYAREEDANVAALLEQRLPDQEYGDLDEVAELLLGGVRPPYPPTPLPVPESGKPPGGDDYLNPSPESGRVREPSPQTQVLEQQTKTQKKQKANQEAEPL